MKANKYERKRIEVAHAKFAFAKNRHCFAHFTHNGFDDALFARHNCANDGTPFHSRYSAYDGVILTRRYCAYNYMDFISRNTRFNIGDFGVSLLWLW